MIYVGNTQSIPKLLSLNFTVLFECVIASVWDYLGWLGKNHDSKTAPLHHNPMFPLSKVEDVFNSTHRGMVIHLVLTFWVVMAFSSSSSCPVFFSFFTRLLTAFSHHFSSCPFCSPFFQPSNLFTIGGVNGKIDMLNWIQRSSIAQSLTQLGREIRDTF